MYTSCFGRLKKIPAELEPVSIARFTPRWAGQIRRELRLAPLRELLIRTLPRSRFVKRFMAQLKEIDPKQIARALGPNAVMLCYEKPGWRCHRRLVANWLEDALGIIVPEFGFPREFIPAFEDMPAPGTSDEDLPWSVACDHCGHDVSINLGVLRVRCPLCKRFSNVEWD